MTKHCLPQELIEGVERGQGALIWEWEPKSSPLPLSLKIAEQLPIRLFITTDQSDTLVEILHQAGHRPIVIANDADTNTLDTSRTVVIQPYGIRSRPETLLDNFADLKARKPRLVELLHGIFARHTVILIHWDPADDSLRDLYYSLVNDLHKFRPTVHALVPNSIAEEDKDYWYRDKGWILLESEEEEASGNPIDSFLLALSQSTQPPLPQKDKSLHPKAKQAGCPYKDLHWFEEQDRDIFWGRDAESLRLAELAQNHRLVLLFGVSGAGKTSLIKAGATPLLRRWGSLPMYVRPGNDPIRALEVQLRKEQATSPEDRSTIYPMRDANTEDDRATALPNQAQLQNRARARQDPKEPIYQLDQVAVSPQLENAPLRQMLREISQRENRTLIVFMDQFEELLVRTSEQVRMRCARALGEIVEDHSIDLHLVISIREDFLAELDDLHPWLPGMFEHRLRIQSLTWEAAQEAIVAPAEARSLHFEYGLVNTILNDLVIEEHVEPPQLQIVCYRLWQSIHEQGKIAFDETSYASLGGAQRILSNYLTGTLDQVENKEKTKEVLKALATSEGTKAPLSLTEVAQKVEITPAEVERILTQLINYRLARAISGPEGEAFELSHEHLVAEITSWMDEDESEAKKIHDMLRGELDDWRRLGLLMGKDKLHLVKAKVGNPYFRPSDEENELLARSALINHIETDYWLGLVTPQRALRLFRQAYHQSLAPTTKSDSIKTIEELSRVVRETPVGKISESWKLPREKGRLNQEITEFAIEASRDPSPAARLAAIDLLDFQSKDKEARAQITAMCQDSSHEVSEKAKEKRQETATSKLQRSKRFQLILISSCVSFAVIVGIWNLHLDQPSREMIVWRQLILLALGLTWLFFLRVGWNLDFSSKNAAKESIIGYLVLFALYLLLKPILELELVPLFVPALDPVCLLCCGVYLLYPLVAGISFLAAVAGLGSGKLWNDMGFPDAVDPIDVRMKLVSSWNGFVFGLKNIKESFPWVVNRVGYLVGSAIQFVVGGQLAYLLLGILYAFFIFFSYGYFLSTDVRGKVLSIFRILAYNRRPWLPTIRESWTGIWPTLSEAISQLATIDLLCSLIIIISVCLLLFRLAKWFLTNTLPGLIKWSLISSLCISPLIILSKHFRTTLFSFFSAQSIAELSSWIGGLSLEQTPIWQHIVMASQMWLPKLPYPWAKGITVTSPPEWKVLVMLAVIGLLLWCLLVLVHRLLDDLVWSSNDPVLLLPWILALLVFRALQTIWSKIETTSPSWLSTLQKWWIEVDFDWNGPPVLRSFLLLAIVVLLGLILHRIVKIVILPLKTASRNHASGIGLLGLIPAIYAWVMGVTSQFFLVALATPILLLCFVALLRPAWGHLWEEQSSALRILGGSLGCAISLSLVSILSPGSCHTGVLEVAVVGLLVGSIITSTAGTIWFGPVGWILLTAIWNLNQDATVTYATVVSTIHSTLTRFGWINVLLVILAFFVTILSYWKEIAIVSPVVWHIAKSRMLRVIQHIAGKLGIWSLARIISAKEEWQAASDANILHNAEQRRKSIHQDQDIQMRWRLRILATVVAMTIILLVIALPLLVAALHIVEIGLGVNAGATPSIKELLVQIGQDPEAIAYAVGLVGGLGLAELLVRRMKPRSENEITDELDSLFEELHEQSEDGKPLADLVW